MISFDEAVEIIRNTARPLGSEIVPLDECADRVLAAPITARVASPRRDVSAMDGYAVRDADVGAYPVRLRVAGESSAGSGCVKLVGPGECVRIFTGAPVPEGTDRVVIQENVRREGEWAIIDEAPGSARHVRTRGGDFDVGDVMLETGRRLGPRAIVAAAGADVAEVEVFRRPRLVILGTGDELAAPGTAAANPEAIPESVSFGVAALAEQWGGLVRSSARLRDDLEAMQRAAADAVAGADLVVVTGGASVGERDFAKAMFERQGLELLFSKVAIKPGKPVWLGLAGGALIMGLPGNPTSALVTARLLLAPLLCGLTGRSTDQALCWRSAPLVSPLKMCGNRETFHRARWCGERIKVLQDQDSSAQKALAASDLLVRQMANAAAQEAESFAEVLEF